MEWQTHQTYKVMQIERQLFVSFTQYTEGSHKATSNRSYTELTKNRKLTVLFSLYSNNVSFPRPTTILKCLCFFVPTSLD